MIMAQVLDYSAGLPGAMAIARAGYAGAVRYIGTPGRTKDTTGAEVDDFSRHGAAMALVFQNTTGDWQGGAAAGEANARRAREHATAIGFPGGRPIYMAIDRDIVREADFVTVMSYLDGAASVLGPGNVGVYGEHDVVKRALEGGHARYGWQTAAWSGGRHYAAAHLYQRIGTVHVGGIACDVNDVLAADWGQHNYVGDIMTPDQEKKLLEDVAETRRLLTALNAGATDYLPTERKNIGTWAAELRQSQANTESGIASIRAAVGELTDDEANILSAVRAQTSGQPTAEQMDALAAQLKASLGPAVADELGRRLSS